MAPSRMTHPWRRRDVLRTALLAAPLAAAAGRAVPAQEPPAQDAGPTEPSFALPTRIDRVGRVIAPVRINGLGPFRFIVDTGASRSALSQSLCDRLGIVARAGESLRVQGVTGEAVLPAVRVRRLEAGALILEDALLPVLAERVFADTDGILGIEGLGGRRLEIDFERDRVEISRSVGVRPRDEDFLVVPVTLRRGGLAIAEARVGRIRTLAIIDTGAERTLGNPELGRRLAASREPGGSGSVADVLGATEAVQSGDARIAPRIRVGDALLDDLEVTFGDLHVFRVWGVQREPALLIGMDLLGTLRRFMIDYRAREMYLLP